MSDLDQRIRAKLLSRGHDIGMLHRGLAAVLDACKELDDFADETYSDAAAFRVRESLAYALGVSGEDRSEPTPAPREPRQFDRDEPSGVTKVRDRLGRVWNRNDRNGFWYEHGCAPQTWPELWSQLRPLSEVVSPEGTS